MSSTQQAIGPDGARIGFDVTGDGAPLVLLAGQSNSHTWWHPVREDFDAYRTIAIDHAGTGASDDIVDGEWSTRRFAADVVCVLDELGIARAHVYGTSMGGRVAQWVAADYPDRVATLVLGCTTAGGAGAVPAEKAVLRRLLADQESARQALEDLMVSPQWRLANPGPLPVLGDDSMTHAARRGHRHASERHDAWEVLPTLGVPTLVLHGGADELSPPGNGELLAERIPDARLEVLPGARHAYFLEYREQASATVLSFLAGQPDPLQS